MNVVDLTTLQQENGSIGNPGTGGDSNNSTANSESRMETNTEFIVTSGRINAQQNGVNSSTATATATTTTTTTTQRGRPVRKPDFFVSTMAPASNSAPQDGADGTNIEPQEERKRRRLQSSRSRAGSGSSNTGTASSNWKEIMEKVYCQICELNTSSTEDRNLLVLCNQCDLAFHQKCHYPNISWRQSNMIDVPWNCAKCDPSQLHQCDICALSHTTTYNYILDCYRCGCSYHSLCLETPLLIDEKPTLDDQWICLECTNTMSKRRISLMQQSKSILQQTVVTLLDQNPSMPISSLYSKTMNNKSKILRKLISNDNVFNTLTSFSDIIFTALRVLDGANEDTLTLFLYQNFGITHPNLLQEVEILVRAGLVSEILSLEDGVKFYKALIPTKSADTSGTATPKVKATVTAGGTMVSGSASSKASNPMPSSPYPFPRPPVNPNSNSTPSAISSGSGSSSSSSNSVAKPSAKPTSSTSTSTAPSPSSLPSSTLSSKPKTIPTNVHNRNPSITPTSSSSSSSTSSISSASPSPSPKPLSAPSTPQPTQPTTTNSSGNADNVQHATTIPSLPKKEAYIPGITAAVRSSPVTSYTSKHNQQQP